MYVTTTNLPFTSCFLFGTSNPRKFTLFKITLCSDVEFKMSTVTKTIKLKTNY